MCLLSDPQGGSWSCSPCPAGRSQAKAGMTSVWQGLGVARGRRSRQMLTEENQSPEPGPRKPPASSLDSLCTRLSRRLPLSVLDANFQDGPSWEPLEGSERSQGAGRSARKALGSVAQKIQKSYQGGSQRRETGHGHGGIPHPTRRRRRSAGLSGAPSPGSGARWRTPTPSSQGSGLRRLSRWITKDPLLPLRRRSQREAALRSPYSSPAPLCSMRGGCLEEEEEVESVAAGIQQLKRLSQAFDEAIATDESDLTVSLIQN
ncbi:protein PIMREG isoform X2 [Vombatus ursinus]|uniref:PICALM interacting mitotic regulator n=1 Tax=Vombatus ursinus TaxID=29139 RepID=A0A4X2ME40_VOMUR|nr:protein PIMREG isoform X2 [Vombatus ursinus]XP_027704626.1 protein PIMREG isoform X2 [Vombatus ursinus]